MCHSKCRSTLGKCVNHIMWHVTLWQAYKKLAFYSINITSMLFALVCHQTNSKLYEISCLTLYFSWKKNSRKKMEAWLTLYQLYQLQLSARHQVCEYTLKRIMRHKEIYWFWFDRQMPQNEQRTSSIFARNITISQNNNWRYYARTLLQIIRVRAWPV